MFDLKKKGETPERQLNLLNLLVVLLGAMVIAPYLLNIMATNPAKIELKNCEEKLYFIHNAIEYGTQKDGPPTTRSDTH